MLVYTAMGFISVVAFFVTASRVIPLRRLLGFGTLLDVVFSLGIFAAFQGTITGLLIATTGGLIMAFTISILRQLIGYDEPHFSRYGLRVYCTWKRHPRRPIFNRTKKDAKA